MLVQISGHFGALGASMARAMVALAAHPHQKRNGSADGITTARESFWALV
jgi:hypothetical protein